jgi:hypothetical protein
MYPFARLMSTKKLWERKEAFIRHPINRDCETSVPPQGRAFALSARRRSCNGAGYLSRLRTAKGLPVAAPSFRDLYGRVGTTNLNQTSCVRARLQSCRKMAQKKFGFQPLRDVFRRRDSQSLTRQAVN